MRWRGAGSWLAGVALLTLVVLPACGLEHHSKTPDDEDSSDFSADQLELGADGPLLDALDPGEREALQKSGMSEAPSGEDEAPVEEPKSEKAGKVGLSVLSVAMTIGAAVAPFFLF